MASQVALISPLASISLIYAVWSVNFGAKNEKVEKAKSVAKQTFVIAYHIHNWQVSPKLAAGTVN